MVERQNQGIDGEAGKDGRTAHGRRDPANPENAHAPAETTAAEAAAAVEKAAHPGDLPAAGGPLSRSSPAASPAGPSPADADGIPPQPQTPDTTGPAELVPSPPVPVYHVHDLAYRGLLSVKAVFLDFLRSFVPADWVRDLDEDSFTQVESTLVLQDLRKREPDVVWRGRLRTDGREIVVVVLVEVQSTVETKMALRLLGYMTAIWQKEAEKRTPGASTGSSGSNESLRSSATAEKLPAIVPIVIYNGKRPWTAARRFRELIEGAERFSGRLVDFEYWLIDVRRLREEELLGLSGAMAAVFWLDGTREEAEVARRLRRLVRLLSRVPEDQVGPLLDWVSAVLASRLPAEEGPALLGRLKEVRSGEEAEEVATNFERMLDRWLEKTERRGWEKGRAEGLKATAVRLMAEGMDDAFIARVTGLSFDEIARLRQAEQARQK